MGKAIKSIVSAITKVVKAIVKVVKFIVDAIVGFVKGIFQGNWMSLVMIVLIWFLGPAVLGFLTMEGMYASMAMCVLLSHYQEEQAEKLKERAEADLAVQAENAKLTAEQEANAYFDKMEKDRYIGYSSGQMGVSPILTSGEAWTTPSTNELPKKESNGPWLLLIGAGLGILGFSVAEG